jgi:hypothetical protein
MSKTNKTKKLSPEEEKEREENKILSETNQKIEEIILLLQENHTRDSSAEEVEKLKYELDHDSDSEIGIEAHKSVFHLHKGKRIAMKIKNSKLLKIADAMEIKLKTHSHRDDLNKALTTHVMRKIKILDSKIARLIKQNQ